MKTFGLAFGLTLAVLNLGGCSVEVVSTPTDSKSAGSPSANGTAHANGAKAEDKLSGEIAIAGSSTVFLIADAAQEAFRAIHPDLKIGVAEGGTGGGFDKFARGELDIANASRPIKESEAKNCQKNGIEYVELKVAIDGLSVVVNAKNDFCDALTVAQLKQVWSPGSKISKWSELNSAWPDEKIELYGADVKSGTFDYFTEAIVGKAKSSRTDYTYNSDDNILVQGVAGDKYSLGYFGYAYYLANKDKLKVLKIAAGDDVAEAVAPTDETILSGTYKPLSRPLFVYANKANLKKPQVAAFLKFLLNDGQKCVMDSGYIQLPEAELAESRRRLDESLAK